MRKSIRTEIEDELRGVDDLNVSIQLNTDELPEKDRLALWREEFCRRQFKMDIEAQTEGPFMQKAAFKAVPGLAVSVGGGSAVRAWRTAQHISDSHTDPTLHIHLQGICQLTQINRQTTIKAGEAVFISGEDPLVADCYDLCEYMSLRVPRQALLDRLPRQQEHILDVVPARSEALMLLRGYVSSFTDPGTTHLTGKLREIFVSHIHDLCAVAINPVRDTIEQGKGGLRAARLHGIKQDIQHNLNQDMSVETVAARHGISTRYLHRLFEVEGQTTFSEFLINARVERAFGRLTSAVFDHQTVAYIAYEAGFADLSHFNRCFKRRYGVTPSEARAAAKSRRRIAQP